MHLNVPVFSKSSSVHEKILIKQIQIRPLDLLTGVYAKHTHTHTHKELVISSFLKELVFQRSGM